MPQYRLVDEASGRWMDVEASDVPSEEQAKFLWSQYDALKVASAGPKGSEERRRAMAQEVAAQSQQSFAEASGGSTASTATTMAASLGQGLSEAGTKPAAGAVRGLEILKEVASRLSPSAEAIRSLNPESDAAVALALREPEQINQDVASSPFYQRVKDLESEAKVTYPVNPDKPWANLPGQAIGSAAQMLASGPARIVTYTLGALESGTEGALEAGATPSQAMAQGMVEGAMGGVSEKLLGLAPFLKEVGGKTLREVGRMGGRAVGRVMAQEVIQEPTEGILNRLSSKYVTGANPNEVVLDPQTLAMEAAGGTLGAASIQIPTIGAARIQRQRDVMGRREMGLAGRSEQQLQAELEAFNRGIQQSQLTGGEGQLVLRAGDPFQTQLDLSAQNAPPQFQMVEAPAAQPRPTLAAVNELGLLEQSRQAQFPAGGAAVQPEQPQSILPQGDLMSRLRDARKMDELRQPSPMSAAALGTGQPVGGPPALNPMTDWLQVYEAAQNQAQESRPLSDEQRVTPHPQAEAQAPQGDQVRQGQAARRVGRRVNLRAPAPKPQKSSQTTAGSNEETASVMPAQPPAGEAPLSRSEPAAAQGVATEGAGVSQEETPAFGVRRYGDARFISIAEYNRLRPQVDERIAAGDQVAKRIDGLEINAERELGKAAGFSALTPEGQEQAVGNFKTKLYQSAGKWLDGGDFEFSSAVIAKSIASDIGKSKEERARKLSQPGESSEEGGEETLGAFDRASTQKVLPQEKPKAPIKLREETVLTMRNLQRQLGASIAQFKNVLAAYSNPEMEAELDDAEVGMLEQARPTLARLDKINYSVVETSANTALFPNPAGGYKRLPVVFLRSGKPPGGASGKFLSGKKVGTEKGVSVYEAWNDPKTGKFLLNDTASDAVQGADDSRQFYLVEGELMPGETGSDGEPLLKPGTARIVREIKLGDIVSTVDRGLAIDGSELDDNQIPRVETASALIDGTTANSISSLIREPIGRSRALQAVDKWKLETGAVGARIEVVEDPNLTTPDGRPVAAMVETQPGELPLITINAAHIASEEEVREKLWHEALHPVWGDAGVQAAWAEVLKALPASAVQAELARGYSPLEATMEAAINAASIRAANTPVRSAWQKFLDAVWEALSRVFGFDTKPKDFEQLMEGALRSLSRPYNQQPDGTEGSIRYSVANSFAMAKNPAEIQKRLETSSDPESLIAMGKAAASLITPEFQQLVKSVEDAAPGTPEAAMRTFLKRAGQIAQTGEAVVEWGKTHETPIPAFRSLNDLPAEWQGVVGNAMTGAHFALGQQVRSIDRAIEKTADELTRVAADFSEADEKRLVAEATKSEAKRLLDGLLRLIEVERSKLGTSSQTLSKEEADAAAMAVSQIKRGKLAVLSKGLETMAREMPIAGFTSNAEALAWLRSRQQTAPIFGQDAQDAYNALEKALQRQPDLTKRIEQIRALTLDNVDAVREVGQLGKLLGKNKGNTIRNYAKLRADYESAFRQFKSLSDRMDRLSNRMDGLLRAKEAIVNLTSSPEYNAKLGDVFGNNKAMLSGLMAPVMERGQPTGVIEFYAPSAYNANGGIKPGGKVSVYGEPGFEKADGLIYRIDWKPDFAIERKNVEAITGLVSEITEALYNPESKNSLKDPLARASYERVLNYVQKFLVDNRYLTEQQWKDSILLTGLKAGGIGAGLPGLFMQFFGSLYTTRMNAARASGGRGGAQWEEANRAVDAFEKKSENTLRDTRTENAEARRAAIESHNMNPDDPMAIEEWSAHISAVIGSMQNPSQDQLKEGDYVGGMQVTKEDLRSARIQKQFSSGIVSDFNNMATSFAEVVNPEEEIGGILFTRAAEDYGMKTRREFSQWGREFADLWKIATEEDLKAFRAKQANATGDEQVQMVWDAREKLADKQIAGPVWSHISETNSEFTSKDSSQIKAAFARIRKDLKAGRTDGLQTVNAIASTIAELTADENGEGGLSHPQAKEALLQAVDRDVSGYLRAVNAFDESKIGGSSLPEAIMSVKAANGALALARGKMVAPTWFYDYGIHDDYKRSAEVANGKRILLMKVYETMTAYRNAVKRKLEDAKREIRENASKMGRDGRPVGLAKAEKEYDRKASAQYKEGGIFATRKMLEATLKLVEGQLDGLKGHLASSSGFVAEVTLGVRALKAFLGGWASFLLSSGNSIINNLTSTTLDTYRTWDTTNRFWLKVFAIAKANGRLIRFIASDILFSSLPSSIKRNISKRQKSALLDTVSKILEGAVGERLLMEEMGQIQSFESLDSIRRRLRANPLTFGVTRTPSNSAIERGAAWLYNKAAFAMALGSWVKERSPGYFDGLLNRTIATDATAFVEWLTPHLLSWARSQPGETVEEKIKSALESTLTPESIGVTTEGLALIRDYMRGYGSLENLAAKSLSDNGLDGLKVPNSLTNEEMKAIQFDAGRKYNIRASSTTPDYAKGGAGFKGVASNVLHMFMGWVLQRMGTDANQFFKTKGGGAKKEWEVAWKALMLVLVTLMTGALYKIPKDLWRAATGNPATTPNILQAIDSPEMALRYLAASTAGVFPVGGEIAAELMGGSGISSPLNNNFLDNNPAAGFLASLLATGKRVYQTGDLKYPLVDFTRKNFWPAGVVLNYAMPGDVEARGAARAVRMGAAGMEVRPTGGGVGARETPATPLVRDAVAALYEGDSAAYQKARQKFIAYQIGQGKTQKEAEKRFESSVSGRDPLRSVLGRQPTADEEATILRRLTPGQRRTVTKAQSLFRKPKKVRLGGARKSRKIRLGRRRPARRSVRLRRSGA